MDYTKVAIMLTIIMDDEADEGLHSLRHVGADMCERVKLWIGIPELMGLNAYFENKKNFMNHDKPIRLFRVQGVLDMDEWKRIKLFKRTQELADIPQCVEGAACMGSELSPFFNSSYPHSPNIELDWEWIIP